LKFALEHRGKKDLHSDTHQKNTIVLRDRLILVFIMLIISATIMACERLSGSFRSPSPSSVLQDAIVGKPFDGNALCKNVLSKDLNGAFRELDCLVTFRRAFPQQGKAIDNLIIEKFRSLYKRLQEESNDWRTVSRWKALYILGTRMYPVENKWSEDAEIPVYEFNGHHLAVPFWIKERLKNKNLGALFHLDTHHDMRAVPRPQEVIKAVNNLRRDKKIPESWHTIAHAIYDCAMPVAGGILTADYRTIVWGKPVWNGYQEFINRPFFLGVPKSNIPVHIMQKDLTGSKLKKMSKRVKDDEKKRSHFRLYYDPSQDKQLPPIDHADAWIKISNPQTPVREKFDLYTPFTMSILTTDGEIDEQGKGAGEANFAKLLLALPKGPFTLDLDLDYFASIDSTTGFKRKAGSDPEWQLEKFHQRRKFLQANINKFRTLLIALRNHDRIPALITIADSTYLTFALDLIAEGQSEYTPIEHAAFLRQEVRQIFREVYGDKVLKRKHQIPLPQKSPATQQTNSTTVKR
jgi:hypothetical protein